MSSLQCSTCLNWVSIQDQNFPEDLFDLLLKYSIPGFHWSWKCKACDVENGFGDALDVKDKVKLLEDRVKILELDMGEIKNLVNYPAANDGSGIRVDNNPGEFNAEDSGLFNSDFSGYRDSLPENCSSTISMNCRNTQPSPTSGVVYTSTPHSMTRKVSFDDASQKQIYKEAHTIMHRLIKEKIKIDTKESEKSSCIVTNFLKDIIPAFKKTNVVFNSMYERDYKTGSSYNDLKISTASEYDIEIVLKAPPRITFKVEFFPQTLTFAKLKWINTSDFPQNKQEILHFFEQNSENGYLKPLKISAWFHGLIDKYLNSAPKVPGIKKMKHAQSGPARTIEIETDEGYKLSIDLLPAITFSYDDLQGTKINGILQKYPVDKSKMFWFLVPKTCKSEVPLLSAECDFSWRVDFPEVEKKVLFNMQCAKNVVKFLKLLRDIKKWNIASYHLKTLILWAIHENPAAEHWHGSVLFDRYLEALTSLQKFVENNHLPYFMDDSYNLFHVLNKDECRNLSNCIQHCIKLIKSDCTNLNVIYS